MVGKIHPRMDRPKISLTFDDGPDPVWTPRVLDALEAVDARATFFVISPLARRYPAVASEILERGHSVEFHCTQHVRHTEKSREEIEADTREGLETLESLGVRPGLWRPPWGVLASWTESVAEEFGLGISLWDVDTHDWRGDTATEMLDSITPMLKPDSVILMHDGLGPGALRSGCEETIALIPQLAEHLRSSNYELAPLKQLPAQKRVRA
jgi:peptidoglycan-N-acetylglucosamine deacetylase